MTVLLVDDSEDVRTGMKLLLKVYGYSVLEASDGETAVRLAKEQLPELIFMDLMMPVMDGFEAIRQLRECEETKHLTIIALSSSCSDLDWRKPALQSGADEWLSKSSNIGKVVKLLNVHKFARYLNKGKTLSRNSSSNRKGLSMSKYS